MNFTKSYHSIKRLTTYAGSELLPTTKDVYLLLLAFHENHNQDIFPSQDYMAYELGVSEASVKRAVALLVKMGWINSKRRPNTSNLYSIALTPDQILSIATANGWTPERPVFEIVKQSPVSDEMQTLINDDVWQEGKF